LPRIFGFEQGAAENGELRPGAATWQTGRNIRVVGAKVCTDEFVKKLSTEEHITGSLLHAKFGSD